MGNSIGNSVALEQLIERFAALRPDSPREWGTMTAGEMLCHLTDAAASILDRGSIEHRHASAAVARNRPVLKWFALRSPLPWPRGQLKTPAHVDPHAEGTKPGDFEADRRRAVKGLRDFASAPASDLAASHGAFGRMTIRDWHRWAYRHTDHHLCQFGL